MGRKILAGRVRGLALVLLGLLAAPLAARCEVTRFEIVSVERPALQGRVFGRVGTYEKLVARATVAIDPADRRNAGIADISLTPRNAEGRVEATADVVILRPVDPAKGNGTLFYEVVNRGRKLGIGLFNDAREGASKLETAGDAGDGYLMEQGYTLVWSGWQADFKPTASELGITVPTLTGVTGPAREEIIFDNTKNPAVAAIAWPAAADPAAALTVRAKWTDLRQTPAGMSFRFTDPTHIEITRPAGFDAGALYELTYMARDPKVLGLGFAAVRDLVAFLRRDAVPSNPLASDGKQRIRRAYAYGSSQSGRFLREFLYLGFNEDMSGRPIFDAMLPHIAGARMTAVNARFGLPGRNSRHAQDPAWTADRFPFTYGPTTDPFTGSSDSLMARCRTTRTCPKVIQADSEHEWWASRASLLVTDPKGRGISLPADVRAFLITGTPHLAAVDAVMKPSAMCQMPLNPLHHGPVMRALLSALDAWSARGIAPPDSRVPTLANGGLVAAETAQPPRPIPGLPYTGIHTQAFLMDHGVFPPTVIGEYPVYVPRMDRDGMVAAGVRMPVLEAPLATYTGWNPRAPGYGPTTFCALQGGVVPLAATRAERIARSDPRRSVEERFKTKAAYVAAVRAASDRLVKARLMLPADVERQVGAARQDRLSRLHPDPTTSPVN